METYNAGDFEILMNTDEASDPISWRMKGDEEWERTPFQTADASHSVAEAMVLVEEWLDNQ